MLCAYGKSPFSWCSYTIQVEVTLFKLSKMSKNAWVLSKQNKQTIASVDSNALSWRLLVQCFVKWLIFVSGSSTITKIKLCTARTKKKTRTHHKGISIWSSRLIVIFFHLLHGNFQTMWEQLIFRIFWAILPCSVQGFKSRNSWLKTWLAVIQKCLLGIVCMLLYVVGISEDHSCRGNDNIHATVSSTIQHASTHHWTRQAPWVFAASPVCLVPRNLKNKLFKKLLTSVKF